LFVNGVIEANGSQHDIPSKNPRHTKTFN